MAIVDGAARRAQHLGAHAILLRQTLVVVVLLHLQVEQPDPDQAESGGRQHHQRPVALLSGMSLK